MPSPLLPRFISFGAPVYDGYIWRLAKRRGATIFFRGIRSWDRDGPEERSLQILNTWGPLLLGPLVWPIPTQYLEGNPNYNHISSSLIRQICDTTSSSSSSSTPTNETLSDLVPPSIVSDVAKLYGSNKTNWWSENFPCSKQNMPVLAIRNVLATRRATQ